MRPCRAEQRNAEQARHIDRLEASCAPSAVTNLRSSSVSAVSSSASCGGELPVSALYEVLPDRLIIASDPVFIFGKGELGAEVRSA